MSSFADRARSHVQSMAAPRAGEVQLRALAVNECLPLLDCAARLLSADEHERMSRMRAGAARDEVILARAALRALLGRMLACAPHAVPLTTSVDGKPQLDARHTSAPICFNVSHSHGQALLAFTCGVAVGVDLERIDPGIEAEDIARQNFTAAEQDAVLSAATAERARVFAAIWVRKEAVLKAHGAGLMLPLASFSVEVQPGEAPVELADAGGKTSRFFLRELEAPEGFLAALAAAEPGLELHMERLSVADARQLFCENPA